MMPKTALVVGASGIVGSGTAALLAERSRTVHGLARRPIAQAGACPVMADLRDAPGTAAALADIDPDAVCRETGRPFAFPGSAAQWNGLTDMSDADPLAQHLLWAAETEAAYNAAFNVVNGDIFRWQRMWSRIAEWFGVDAAPFDGAVRPL